MLYQLSYVRADGRIARLAQRDSRETGELREGVRRLDAPERARAGAHHERVRDGAVARVADAAEQRARGHARRRDEEVVACDEVVRGQHLLGVVAGGDQLLALGVVTRPEPPLEGTAERLDGGGRNDALRRAADAHQQVRSEEHTSEL